LPWGDRLNFTGAHILSINQFQRQDVERVFAVADQMRPYALRKKVTRVLEGAILGNMFFEASTRTRVSFGSAFNLLGARFARPPASRVRPWLKASRCRILPEYCLALAT